MLVTGWKYINGKWYYFDKVSYAAYLFGCYDIKGRDYCFNYNGEWIQEGWCEYRKYVAKAVDNTCILVVQRYYNYIINGSPVKNQMIEINGSLYCFDADGVMLTDQTDYSTRYGSDDVIVQIGSDGVVNSWKKYL